MVHHRVNIGLKIIDGMALSTLEIMTHKPKFSTMSLEILGCDRTLSIILEWWNFINFQKMPLTKLGHTQLNLL